MKVLTRGRHLARRFGGSLSRRAPSVDDVAWVTAHLSPGEANLWQQMPVQDRRHSISVARRFVEIIEQPTRAEIAGALLHDIGKLASSLGTLGRVVATVIGPRTKRFRQYHDHEQLGAAMLRSVASEQATLDLVEGSGRAADALSVADAT